MSNKNSLVRIGLRFGERTKENKAKFLYSVKKLNYEAWDKLYNKSSIQADKERIINLSKLEDEGGFCLKCGTPWVQIKKENVFYMTDFWFPGCHCYIKCPLCGKSLLYEEESGELRKDGYRCKCRFKLKRNGNNFYGQRYERENFDYLNELRVKNNIYYQEFDGSSVRERIKK